MNVQHLHYFLAVMGTGSVSRAAAELGVTQPTLSQAMKRLEQEFGASLFAPDGRGIRATSKARRLEASVRAALQSLAEAKRELAGDAPAPLKVGVLPTLPAALLPALIQAHDGALDVVEAAADDLETAVAGGVLDLAVSIEPRRSLRSRTLLRQPFRLFVGPDHQWSGRRSVGLAELDGQPFVLRQRCELLGSGRRLLGAAGVRFRVVAKTQQESTAATLVTANLGCTLAPAGWGGATLGALDVSGLRLERTLALVWRKPEVAKAAAKFAPRLAPQLRG